MNHSIVKELKEKYNNIDEILNKRYNNDTEILNFYQEYYNEIEQLERFGFNIWKMFGQLWEKEEQTLIINLLSLILILEQQVLKIKRMIVKMCNQKKNARLQSDKEYLFKIIDNYNYDHTYNNIKFINIQSSYDDLVDMYTRHRTNFKNIVEKEYQRIISETESI